jgi:hypothetical protein
VASVPGIGPYPFEGTVEIGSFFSAEYSCSNRALDLTITGDGFATGSTWARR